MAQTVDEFTPDGNIRLDDGWVVAADAGHWNHAYCVTSFGFTGENRPAGDSRYVEGVAGGDQSGANVRVRQPWQAMDADLHRRCRSLKAAVQRSSQKLAALDLKRPVRQDVPQPAVKPQRWHRLRKHLERLRRLAVIDRTRAAWTGPATERSNKKGRPIMATHDDKHVLRDAAEIDAPSRKRQGIVGTPAGGGRGGRHSGGIAGGRTISFPCRGQAIPIRPMPA